jgi:hypothetical protein
MRRSLVALWSSGRRYSDALDPSSGAAHLLCTCKHCPAVFAGFSLSSSCCSAPRHFPRKPSSLLASSLLASSLPASSPPLPRSSRSSRNTRAGPEGTGEDRHVGPHRRPDPARLRAAGYPDSLLDQYLPSSADTLNISNPTGSILTPYSSWGSWADKRLNRCGCSRTPRA